MLSAACADRGAPSFLDTCVVQFPLSDLEGNGRQHAVLRVLTLWVVEYLDAFEEVSSGFVAGRISLAPWGEKRCFVSVS